MRTVPNRSRGMTLIEIMIAMLLASIVSAFILMITRSQLIAYEQTDQVSRMQQNERAGVGFVEAILRRACGGISNGLVGVNLNTTQKLVNCVYVTDGGTTTTDKVDVIYGTKPFTTVTTTPTCTTTPSAAVADTSGFTVGDYVLMTDFQSAVMTKIKTISASSGQGTFTMETLPAAMFYPTGWTDCSKVTHVLKAQAYQIYVEPGTVSSNAYLKNMLMLNNDLYTTTPTPQPIVENVVDFQLAMGLDNDSDGNIATAEWYGDASGELPLATNPWNSGTNPRQLRMSMIFQTNNVYPGSTKLQPFEDRASASYPSSTGGSPRYRPIQILIAPRAWNLLN